MIGKGVLLSRSAVWRRCVLREQVVADRCILADDTVVAAGAQAFREVMMTPGRRASERAREASRDLRESASLEVLRKVSRAVLDNAAWSRSPAAQ
jgi:hypothetical protein